MNAAPTAVVESPERVRRRSIFGALHIILDALERDDVDPSLVADAMSIALATSRLEPLASVGWCGAAVPPAEVTVGGAHGLDWGNFTLDAHVTLCPPVWSDGYPVERIAIDAALAIAAATRQEFSVDLRTRR